MTQENDTDLVCDSCLGDAFLIDQVIEDGTSGRCSYCGETSQTLTLANLADRIDKVLQRHFEYSGESELELAMLRHGFHPGDRPGEPVTEVIAWIARVSETIADDVRKLLSESAGYVEEDPYGNEARYVERDPETGDFRNTWERFCSGIRTCARFFSASREDALDSIFGGLCTRTEFDDKPVIKELGPGNSVWRARGARTRTELEDIVKSPACELGPPPSIVARAGRMNAKGISVLYGAMDASTCVAEVRPAVGSQVVVSKFDLLQRVRLLDFDALAEFYYEGYHFDPEYATSRGRWAFLSQLIHEISRPVMPEDEEEQYLPTQVVAEYLANRLDPRFDGIIYRSPQTGKGRNVVFFNHACSVKPDDLPEAIDVWCEPLQVDSDGGIDDTIRVLEAAPHDPDRRISPSGTDTNSTDSITDLRVSETPTLELDLKSVCVMDINRVCYDFNRRNVRREPHNEASMF